MSSAPEVRRADKLMPEERIRAMIARGYAGRLATVGPDGWPYAVPLLYVWMNNEVWVHNTAAQGHLRANVGYATKVCFELDEPGEVFPYGRFACDTSVSYRSVILFGHIRIVDDREKKDVFFDALMEKYAGADWNRPKGFYPRIDQVTVYAIAIERMTGKETPLPIVENRWPAADHTRSPNAMP